MHFSKTDDGRLFFYFGKSYDTCFHIESFFLSKKCRNLAIEFQWAHDCESTFLIHFSIPLLISVYLVLDLKYYDWLKKICGEYKTREYGFYFGQEGFKLFFHSDPMCWPSGFQFYQDWERLLKGKSIVANEAVYRNERRVLIPGVREYPDREYDLVIKKDNYVTRYSRWFKKKWHRWEVECEEGVKHPGKGTTDYNCGEDATYSISFGYGMVGSEQEAIDRFIESVTKTRKTYPL